MWRKKIKSNDIVAEFFEVAENNNQQKFVQSIKEKGLDVDSRDNNNQDRTILHIAALKRFDHLIHTLVTYRYWC